MRKEFLERNVIFKIRNTNEFGNNIFIDNINIDKLFGRDLRMVSLNQPPGILCANATSPSVTVQNVGFLTVTGFKVSYSLDNGTPVTSTFTNLSLAPQQTINVTITPSFTAAIGSHTIKVYSWDPVASTGTGDQNPVNDTITKALYVVGTMPAPLSEGFETAAFPPANWGLDNPDGLITWERTTTAARSPRPRWEAFMPSKEKT